MLKVLTKDHFRSLWRIISKIMMRHTEFCDVIAGSKATKESQKLNINSLDFYRMTKCAIHPNYKF